MSNLEKKTVRLSGFDLLSKFGFNDGDLMKDHDTLVKAVREHLLPLLDPRVEIYEIGTSHNPIRVTDETREYVDEDIFVEVPF